MSFTVSVVIGAGGAAGKATVTVIVLAECRGASQLSFSVVVVKGVGEQQ